MKAFIQLTNNRSCLLRADDIKADYERGHITVSDGGRIQMSQDAAFFAANEVLGLGPGRAQAFGEAYIRYVNEMAELIVDDSQGDRAIEYSKHVVDRKLSGIVGEENFKPFDVRYGRRE